VGPYKLSLKRKFEQRIPFLRKGKPKARTFFGKRIDPKSEGVVGKNKMKEYRVTIGTDERKIPGTMKSYSLEYGKIDSDTPTSTQDYQVVAICKRLAQLLKTEETEIIIKSK